jgi:hypothetical protein
MACGAKKPSEKAREWFRRPAYFVGKSDEIKLHIGQLHIGQLHIGQFFSRKCC